MLRTPALQVKAIVLTPPMAATMQNVAGQLAPTSRKTYTTDAKHFAQWLAGEDLSLTSLARDDLTAYRAHLAETYAQSTAARMWAVARQLLDEAVHLGLLPKNPAEGIRGFKAGEDESPHQALKREEAKALLDAIDRSSAIGKRDYALLMLLLRTGMRRAEGVALTIGDLVMEQGYHVVIIRHGKGNKRGLAKLPAEVRQTIDDYLETAGRACTIPEALLFVNFRKGNHPNQIERIVKQWAQAVGITCLRMRCGQALLRWPLRTGHISRSCRMGRGIKILEPRGDIRSEEITCIKMQLILFGSERTLFVIIHHFA